MVSDRATRPVSPASLGHDRRAIYSPAERHDAEARFGVLYLITFVHVDPGLGALPACPHTSFRKM